MKHTFSEKTFITLAIVGIITVATIASSYLISKIPNCKTLYKYPEFYKDTVVLSEVNSCSGEVFTKIELDKDIFHQRVAKGDFNGIGGKAYANK